MELACTAGALIASATSDAVTADSTSAAGLTST